MHAIKGGWVQTFALAKCNDSGGKKSRIRRSKEERKAMVESFIKKYQNLNHGSFPSLNLTHKEVGGSFYTVREIVREIIQENRVLGPAKFTTEEQNDDMFLEQYPLGSISIEPQTSSLTKEIVLTHVVPSHHQSAKEEQDVNFMRHSLETEHQNFDNEKIVNGKSQTVEMFKESDEPIVSHVLPSYVHQGTNEELLSYSNGKFSGTEHQRFDDGQTINGSKQAVENIETSDEPIYTELQVRESLDGQNNGAKELEIAKARMTRLSTDVVVETFPLRPVSATIYCSDGKSGEAKDSDGTLKENEILAMNLETGNNYSVTDKLNFLEDSCGLKDKKDGANLAGPLSEQNSGLMDEKAAVPVAEPMLESSSFSSTKASIVVDINASTHFEVKDALPSRIKPMNTPHGIPSQNVEDSSSCSSHELSTSEEATAIKNKSDIQHGVSSQKGSKATLDRINLESWEGTSVKSAGSEANPLLAFFKALVATFVKFWSE